MPIDEVISEAAFYALWAENRMNAKREAGLLTVVVADEVLATNPAYAGGRSRILKLETRAGQHLGTVHEIVGTDGAVLHSHPKDYTRRDCSRVRMRPDRR